MKNMDLLASQFNPFNGTQLCADADPELFFPDYEGDRTTYLRQVAEAKKTCGDCWIKEDCLKYAMQYPDLQGVWGGTTAHDRKALRLQKI